MLNQPLRNLITYAYDLRGFQLSGGPGWIETNPDDATRPSLFTALQEQLGGKLETSKGPVDMVVIDHVNRPSENQTRKADGHLWGRLETCGRLSNRSQYPQRDSQSRAGYHPAPHPSH